MSLTTRQKIEAGIKLKEDANDLVRKGEYKKACQLYRRVPGCINGLLSKDDAQVAQFAGKQDRLTDEERKEVVELKATVLGNLALCYLKLQDFPRALQCAEEATNLDKKNVKAWLRMGIACNELGQWEKAKDALGAANALEPQNAAITKEIATWRAGYNKWLEEQKAKEKAAFGGKLLS